LRQACAPELKASRAKGKADDPKPECATADQTIIALKQSEAEKRRCSMAMIKWYREQQTIAEATSGMKRHPQSAAKSKQEAGWP